MALLLCLETATKNCSVASKRWKFITLKEEVSEKYSIQKINSIH